MRRLLWCCALTVAACSTQVDGCKGVAGCLPPSFDGGATAGDAQATDDASATTPSATIVVTPSLATQLSVSVTPPSQATGASGQYCGVVFDPGTLKTSVNFVLRIVHP